MRRSVLFLILFLLFGGKAQATDQCWDLLQIRSLSPQSILLDRASRLQELTERLSDLIYLPTQHLRYMKAMMLEADLMNEYYAQLYAHAYPEEEWIHKGFQERQDFLTAVNVHISDIAKFRDFEKWLVDTQQKALRASHQEQVQVYGVLRDQLNLSYYPLLAQLHDQLTGEQAFFFEKPTPWGPWYKDYVTFLKELPHLSVDVQKSFLHQYVVSEFGRLHEHVQTLPTEELATAELPDLEFEIHKLRRQIRSMNVVLLTNSYLISLVEVDYEGVEREPEILDGIRRSEGRSSRYVSLLPPVDAHPISFPKLSFYSVDHFTMELGKIKDRLERVLYFQTLLPALEAKQKQDPEEASHLAATRQYIHDLAEALKAEHRSQALIESIKNSHLFRFTSSWMKENPPKGAN